MCIHPSSIGRLINQVLGQMETSIIGRVQTAHVKNCQARSFHCNNAPVSRLLLKLQKSCAVLLKVMWSKCKKEAALSKSSNSNTSYCSLPNAIDIPASHGQTLIVTGYRDNEIRYRLPTSRDLTSILRMENACMATQKRAI